MTVRKHPDSLIGKEYDTDGYHCYDFIEECLDVPKLEDIGVLNAEESINSNKPFYIELDIPVNYCLALMGSKHIGIYYDDHIYHADRDMVKCENMRTIKRKYSEITFWDKDI